MLCICISTLRISTSIKQNEIDNPTNMREGEGGGANLCNLNTYTRDREHAKKRCISRDATVASNCIVEPNEANAYRTQDTQYAMGRTGGGWGGDCACQCTHLTIPYRVQAHIEHNVCNCKAIGATTHITHCLMLRNCISRRLSAMQLHNLEECGDS